MIKSYQAKRPLTLPKTLQTAGVVDVAIGDVFTVSIDAALAAGRYLANRITMGDLVEVQTPNVEG